MSLDKTPASESPLLVQPLRWATRTVLRFPRTTLLLALAAAAGCMVLTALRLELKTDRLDLLNPRSAFNRLWLDYIDDFGDNDDAVIVVEGVDPDAVRQALDELGPAIRQRGDLFQDVLEKIDLSTLAGKRLYYAEPDQIKGLDSAVAQLQPIVEGGWSHLAMPNLIGGLVHQATVVRDAAAEEQLALHLKNLRAMLAGETPRVSPWAQLDAVTATDSQFADRYHTADGGRLGIVLLRLKLEAGSFARGSEAIAELRSLLEKFEARFPELHFGLTGLPVMENDEMHASQKATLRASFVSLAGVAVLFVAGFGGIRHPLLTVAALLLAIAWSCGYLTLVVGHLNILSMSFGIILIGLGVDFGIHYLARYLHLRRSGAGVSRALLVTAMGVGPGIVTGAVTTSLAFLSAGLTDFTGVAELGLIAGGGILLCLLAAVVVLPALLRLSDGDAPDRPMPRLFSVGMMLAPVERWPRFCLVGSVILIAVCAGGLPDLWYDHNLLNLQPQGLESVRLEERVLAKSDRSVWFALSLASTPEELRKRKARFERLETVERTEEILSMLPTGTTARQAALDRCAGRLERLAEQPPLLPVAEPEQLASFLEGVAASLGGGDANSELAPSLSALAAEIRQLPRAKVFQAVSEYQQWLAAGLLDRLSGIGQLAAAEPPTLDDLPPALVTRFVGGKTGRYLLKVYSKADIWDMAALERFVAQVRSVDPQATGKPLQTFEASRQMQASYLHAALYALIAVSIVLILDFRSLRYWLLALVPVGLGMLQLFGLLGWLDIPLNPANMIVLPLILGIGLDDGVHVIHDFRCQKRGTYRISRSTAAAILMTSLTTMVGFGSMMVAEHRGLESLGRVLTIGISCCLFTSLGVLPAILQKLDRWLPATPDDEDDEDDEDAGALPAEKEAASPTAA